jgi:hypothetical protein
MGPGFESQPDHENAKKPLPTLARAFLRFPCLLNGRNDLVAQLIEQYTFNVWVLDGRPLPVESQPDHSLRIKANQD